MKQKKEFINRIDVDKIDDALVAADFLAKTFIKTGRYNVNEAWGPEGEIYLSLSSWALMDAYLLSKKDLYINAVYSILKELRRVQKPCGGWTLNLGKNGLGFAISNKERKKSVLNIDLAPTAAVLRTIADYYTITKDDSFLDMGNKTFKYLYSLWDDKHCTLVEPLNKEIMNLRSNPKSYHIFYYKGFSAWKNHEPELLEPILPKLLSSLISIFEDYNEYTMPLLYSYYIDLLLEHGSEDYIENIIKPRIEDHLVNNNVFLCKDKKGGYGHRDGLRGIVTNEAHMRSSVGIAIAMKKYDVITNKIYFRKMKQYKDIANWIMSMRGEDYFYEYELISNGQKLGYGSPGQYLPIWWILGKI